MIRLLAVAAALLAPLTVPADTPDTDTFTSEVVALTTAAGPVGGADTIVAGTEADDLAGVQPELLQGERVMAAPDWQTCPDWFSTAATADCRYVLLDDGTTAYVEASLVADTATAITQGDHDVLVMRPAESAHVGGILTGALNALLSQTSVYPYPTGSLSTASLTTLDDGSVMWASAEAVRGTPVWLAQTSTATFLHVVPTGLEGQPTVSGWVQSDGVIVLDEETLARLWAGAVDATPQVDVTVRELPADTATEIALIPAGTTARIAAEPVGGWALTQTSDGEWGWVSMEEVTTVSGSDDDDESLSDRASDWWAKTKDDWADDTDKPTATDTNTDESLFDRVSAWWDETTGQVKAATPTSRITRGAVMVATGAGVIGAGMAAERALTKRRDKEEEVA